MCGIAGILSPLSFSGSDYKATVLQTVKTMTNALEHRGPDGDGHWINDNGNVCIGHRRLSIIDLSAAAAQPMHFNPVSALDATAKRYTITYNGEIYNYLEIKEELVSHGYHFKTQSDTEVILAAYDFWKEDCLEQFDGMFAFAIWDAVEHILFAARDRFGEKPFYFNATKNRFAFASEMKAFWAMGIDKKADDKMLLNYLTLGYVQNANDKEQTFFEDIYSLPPGHFLQFEMGKFDYEIYPYWKLDKELTVQISAEAAIEKFYDLLTVSVKRRLRSDVATGASLSGGLDSSTIVSIIQGLQKNGTVQKTFSAVFPGFEKDEAAFISSIEKKFKLSNFKITPTAEGLIKDFETLCYHQEEPFPSSSIYAQYKVFGLAKEQQVKVLLDGQGADETMAGYHKYIHWYLQQLINRHKFSTAINEKKIFEQNNISFKWGIGDYLATILPAQAAIQLEKNEYSKIVRQPDINKSFIQALHGREWEGIHKPIITKLNDILFFNTATLGLEELLRFADRNSMAHGREVRLPFLNHELVQFVFSLPANFKIHEGSTKWLLRKTMDKKLPDDIVWRKDKVGYEPPQKQWMENETMKEYMQEAKRKLVNKGILKKEVLDKAIKPLPAHDHNNFDWRYLCAAQITDAPKASTA